MIVHAPRMVRSLLFWLSIIAAWQSQAASLTLYHNNDGESKLSGDQRFGGIAHFVAALERLRVKHADRDQITISSGDNFLAGPAFSASLASGPLGHRTYFDALALVALDFDALTLGNHEFDFGPRVLADFIRSYREAGGKAPFLSSNLDLSRSEALRDLADAGIIAGSTIIKRGKESYGVVGVTTQGLRSVSNPGDVVVNAVLPAIRSEVAQLEAAGVNKIILASHLQDIANEIELVKNLNGVDIVVAGGGAELLLNSDNARNRVEDALDGYPIMTRDADGNRVAIVTTTGEYNYIGKLDVEFDANGRLTTAVGEPVVVDKAHIEPRASVQEKIINTLRDATADAEAIAIATTSVFLEHSANNTNGPRAIRTRETNLGNLIADALVWATSSVDGIDSGCNTLLGLVNGGGVREDLDNDENGVVTRGEVMATLPFGSTLAVVKDVDAAGLLMILENAVSQLPSQSGRFLQISGIAFDYDPTAPSGARVREIRFPNGAPVWRHTTGGIFTGCFDIATVSFLVGGDSPDGYDFSAYEKLVLPDTYSDVLIDYLTEKLDAKITSADYALQGEHRINAVYQNE